MSTVMRAVTGTVMNTVYSDTVMSLVTSPMMSLRVDDEYNEL
jgi:hypothetical protein